MLDGWSVVHGVYGLWPSCGIGVWSMCMWNEHGRMVTKSKRQPATTHPQYYPKDWHS